MDTPDTAAPSLDQLVDQVAQQIRDLDAQAKQAQADYPKAALAARVAASPVARAESAARAQALNETVKRCRAQIEELQPMLAEAAAKLEAESRESRDVYRRQALQEAAKGLQRQRQTASEAEALLKELGQKLAQIVALGRACHQMFGRFMSVDQMHACAPDETALAQAVLGVLLRNGGIDLYALTQLSHLGIDSLHTRESLAQTVDFQATLIESRFDADLLAPRRARKAA